MRHKFKLNFEYDKSLIIARYLGYNEVQHKEYFKLARQY